MPRQSNLTQYRFVALAFSPHGTAFFGTPLGGTAAQNTSTLLESSPGYRRDIDVLADPAFWSEFEGRHRV
jgi:hypothetical protein